MRRHTVRVPRALALLVVASTVAVVAHTRRTGRLLRVDRMEWHAGKPFWDTQAILDRGTKLSIYEIDKLVAPQFPMLPFEIPDEVRMTVDDWVAVIEHAVQLVGEDHVALGTDFDGGPPPPRGLHDVSDLPLITDAMLRRGWPEARIRKFLGENLLRVFGQITR